MRLLLDTHIVFWLALRRSKLNERELAVLLDPDNEITVPSVALWEIRLKWESHFVSGQPKGDASPIDVLVALKALDIAFAPLTADQAAASLRQALPHKDPFDHLLMTQAQELGMRLMTRDGDLRNHPTAFVA